MIVGSLLLILVAVGLLVAGVLSSSNALIICCLVLVVLAAIVLVIGVKQAAAAGVPAFIDEDDDVVPDEAPTGQFTAIPDNGFRRRQPDRRAEDTTEESVPVRSRRGATVSTAPAGGGLVGGAAIDERGPIMVDEPVSSTTSTGAIPSQSTSGARMTARTAVHSTETSTATITMPTASTITDISIRRFCQVIRTSPGRSASHTAANASMPTATR